jgi:hypothetical protein
VGNRVAESFSSKLRDECLSLHWLERLSTTGSSSSRGGRSTVKRSPISTCGAATAQHVAWLLAVGAGLSSQRTRHQTLWLVHRWRSARPVSDTLKGSTAHRAQAIDRNTGCGIGYIVCAPGGSRPVERKPRGQEEGLNGEYFRRDGVAKGDQC